MKIQHIKHQEQTHQAPKEVERSKSQHIKKNLHEVLGSMGLHVKHQHYWYAVKTNVSSTGGNGQELEPKHQVPQEVVRGKDYKRTGK